MYGQKCLKSDWNHHFGVETTSLSKQKLQPKSKKTSRDLPFLAPPKKKNATVTTVTTAMMSPSAPSFHADARSCNREKLGPSDLDFEGIVAHGCQLRPQWNLPTNRNKEPIFPGQITQNCQQQIFAVKFDSPQLIGIYIMIPELPRV